jgi:NAD(P)-dependent dehydrogenase (short-subunit alcohol dehydrogenase family)
MKLNGKVAWVVGGSSGIGAAVARELASRGAAVAISARRKEQLHEVAAGDMLVLPADVTDAGSVAAAAARVREELGPIDLAVLSAGYWKPMDARDWDTDVFDRHIQVNLTGMSNAIAALLPEMLRQRSGTIAGIASVAGYRGLAGAEAYGATKAAQINLLESLRVHVARTGVHVTTVCPGFVHHRNRSGRTVHLRRSRARTRRDRLPRADGPADEGRPPRPEPRMDGPVEKRLATLTARPADRNTPNQDTGSKGHHETA